MSRERIQGLPHEGPDEIVGSFSRPTLNPKRTIIRVVVRSEGLLYTFVYHAEPPFLSRRTSDVFKEIVSEELYKLIRAEAELMFWDLFGRQPKSAHNERRRG